MTPEVRSASDVAEIYDIRRESIQSSIKDDILEGLRRPVGEKEIPSMVLYDEAGLKLFEQITYLDDYYLTNTEIGCLQTHAEKLADHIEPDSIIVELGSGNLRKVRILLDAIERRQKNVVYHALDLDLSELERTLGQLPNHEYKHVKCRGLHGTFNDGMVWLKDADRRATPKCVMFLGSSIGNFGRQDAAAFLSALGQSLGPRDSILIGIDNCQDGPRVYTAYNDTKGVTREFYVNGLQQANRLLGFEVFHFPEWNIVGNYDADDGRHVATVSSQNDLEVHGLRFEGGEQIRFEWSHKYSTRQQRELFQAADLQPRAQYTNQERDYLSPSSFVTTSTHTHDSTPPTRVTAHALVGRCSPTVNMPHASLASEPPITDTNNFSALTILAIPSSRYHLDPQVYAKDSLPSLDDWQQLWSTWDLVSRTMIPDKELLSKPINLRNCCIFYLGHIPTFLDIHLTRATGGKRTEPSYYAQIFERGIDPDVENPELCHAHSDIPEEWPKLDDIMSYSQAVRRRTATLYEDGSAYQSRPLAHALWLGFEHEAMHLETLLYMLLQSESMLPPPGPKTDFAALADQSKAAATPQKWVTIPPRTITLGMDEDPIDSASHGHFGWDNEKPKRQANVHSFESSTRAITNGEYAEYLEACKVHKHPASWGSSGATDLNGSAKGVNGHANGHVNGALNGHTNGTTNGNTSGHTNGDTNGHTNGHTNGTTSPASMNFIKDKTVKTVYGNITLLHALDWPVMASYDELAAYAKWKNGRIPTMEEVQSIYAYVEELENGVSSNVSKTIPAVNGHLSNNGVEETPPSRTSVSRAPSSQKLGSSPDPAELFANLKGCNVGFNAFHPMPVHLINNEGQDLAGRAGLGGAWEWTSSVLEKHSGFTAMDTYPGYTADFFDGKHNVVLGGSWATHPRLAGRKSFVNWYQRNYPYAWCSARLVRDLSN